MRGHGLATSSAVVHADGNALGQTHRGSAPGGGAGTAWLLGGETASKGTNCGLKERRAALERALGTRGVARGAELRGKIPDGVGDGRAGAGADANLGPELGRRLHLLLRPLLLLELLVYLEFRWRLWAANSARAHAVR